MPTIHYARLDEFWRKEEKYTFLEQQAHVGNVAWQTITPDKRHTWLTEGMHDEFEAFLPMGTKEAKAGSEESIFENYGGGVATCRDAWAYNFENQELSRNIKKLIKVYNEHVYRWENTPSDVNLEDFVLNDMNRISWSEGLKVYLQRKILLSYDVSNIRQAMYRPYVKTYLYFDKFLNERRYQLPAMFPLPSSNNAILCISDRGHRENFCASLVDVIPDFHILATKDRFQCFPFYTYAEDGSNRRENITDWALGQFQARYAGDEHSKIQNQKSQIEKWDIFHYVYALLHHPDYRAKYAANLRRELPRIPFVEDFWAFAQAGARLAELHVHYEQQPEYGLDFVEAPDKPLNWRVERMKLSRDKSSLVYNDFLTLAGIPPQVYEYKLGNRSALEWVIDQYQVSIDKRSGIVNDPNNTDDPQHIVRLIGQVITVSLATVQVVNQLPPLQIIA